jgi:glutamate synthase domain-containing protein 2/glutamate synthase domain-containing protein 1/glutamate synthase domain-containing protein 3
MEYKYLPKKQGLYDPQFEHDSCGVGFVCNIKGNKSYEIVENGIKALENLTHRGAVGSDPKTGDGAGILIQIPDEFFRNECENLKIKLPETGRYGVGVISLPQNKIEREYCENIILKFIEKEGLKFLGWREIPVDNTIIGKIAKLTQPHFKHIFIECPKEIKEQIQFERILYKLRKKVENKIRNSDLIQKNFFYISNLSSRTIVYKGLLTPKQLRNFFGDLNNKLIKSSFALIHARYSTNTFPTWDLAQPFRFLAHNGEINTLKGNINWMKSRQGLLKSKFLGESLKEIFPVIVPGGSDSATIDNVLEFLVLNGYDIFHAIRMLIPEAWQNDNLISPEERYFYEYHSCLMEPWDGPAAISFTDGRYIGAILDRNGLRPCRYIITKNDFIVTASEVGVLDIKPEDIKLSNRLKPGEMFGIDLVEGKIFFNEEIKEKLISKNPYKEWVKKHLIIFDKIPFKAKTIYKDIKNEDLIRLQTAFGWTREDLKFIIKPMIEEGQEPTGSMGDDTPLAVLSNKPRPIFHYFKQLFAQVTNPAIDPIREHCVMSLDTYLGKEKNILEQTSYHAHRLKLKSTILNNQDLNKLCSLKIFKTKKISLLFKVKEGKNGFKKTIKRICKQAENAIKNGYTFLLLTDKGVNSEYMSIPILLATGAIHQYLVKKQLRTEANIILETGEAREVTHFALLFGYGADCINPYLALETIKRMVYEKEIEIESKEAEKNYFKALEKGILKILSKMGISTLQSYRGAQIFEALGLNYEVINTCFTGTVSRIGGIGFDLICEDVLKTHNEAFLKTDIMILPTGGLYQWKKDGEYHLWNPDTISLLHQAVRNNDYKKYLEFAEIINNQQGHLTTLRGLLKFKKRNPIPISEVEPAENIIKRFVSAAMSFGSISREAHETIAIAMNRLGTRSNSGEGGEDPARFIPLPNGDSLCSATKQVASGRFGVTINYLVNAKELQIKIAQGAKPGEGGQLPGRKVSVEIAKTRYTTPGVTLISPPPHHDIYSIEDLAQLIFDLKNANPDALISVKLVSEVGVGTIAAGVAKGHADIILISGGDGGTGASPLSSIKYAGLPWELGLAETHQTLVLNDLRSRVTLQVDGQLRTGKDVVIGAILGAEEFGFGTTVLVVLGCVMLRHCSLNNCSVGIATQEECLRKRFTGKPEYLQNYFKFVAEEVRSIMADLGIKSFNDLIGNTELLEVNYEIAHKKAKTLDYSKILYKPEVDKSVGVYKIKQQEHNIDNVLDLELIKLSKRAIENKEPVRIEIPIKNTDRTVGAMLSNKITKFYGEDGLPEDTIQIKFKGNAGQSFGAFLTRGVTFELEGMANDYVGKGLSGGKIIIYPSEKSDFKSEENVIIGNTTFYGATSGEAYISGIAGDRFCIRNSGAYVVVEGVGDHGCEYMTGGRVVILGKTGKNFAAGMSGGIAYVYNDDGKFLYKYNKEMVEIEDCFQFNSDDIKTIFNLISNHHKYTKSKKAEMILLNFEEEIKKFVKVIPIEYKAILMGKIYKEKKLELEEVSDG